MAFLFEYGEWVSILNSSGLKQLLESIWATKMFAEEESPSVELKEGLYQPFLQFDGDKIRGKNYSGFIQIDNELIEIYPKVFRKANCGDKRLMLTHVFYWLSYCRKWRFPFTKANLDIKNTDSFPELIINLIANQIHSVVTLNPLARYQPMEEALLAPRGSINFSRYISNSLSRSNFHLIECDYEPFVFDNRVNRVIKYCSRLLLSRTLVSENIRILQEIIHTLDEVADIPCTLRDIELISLNNFYHDYNNVLSSCKLVLAEQLYSNESYDLSNWCMLLPMEYIFEDFLAGFMQTFSTKWNIEYQKSNLNLSSRPEAFQMQHDIFLTSIRNPSRNVIVDAKYKLRNTDFKSEIKRGVSQADLYQMVSYALRRGCNDVLMLYPNIDEDINPPDEFIVQSGFSDVAKIRIVVAEVPFWSTDNFYNLTRNLEAVLTTLLTKFE